MIYGYIRVSTDKQTFENQKFEIERYARAHQLEIDTWIEETVSGASDLKKRKLGKLMRRLKKGDTLVCTELSRLGRNLYDIMDILNALMKKQVNLWTIKENYRLGNDLNSKVLAFAFGLAAEIERQLISQRTKEALARKRAEGVRLGRPPGKLSAKLKLSGKEQQIRQMLAEGFSYNQIAKKLKVHRHTVSLFVKRVILAGT